MKTKEIEETYEYKQGWNEGFICGKDQAKKEERERIIKIITNTPFITFNNCNCKNYTEGCLNCFYQEILSKIKLWD